MAWRGIPTTTNCWHCFVSMRFDLKLLGASLRQFVSEYKTDEIVPRRYSDDELLFG